MAEKLLNVHEVRKNPMYKKAVEISRLMSDLQREALESFEGWKYWEEFQRGLIKTHIEFARSMEILDPWHPTWQKIKVAGEMILNDLQQMDREIELKKIQNKLGGINGTTNES